MDRNLRSQDRGPVRSRLASLILGLALAVVALPSCAPTFSELQSARLAGPGRWEVTPSYSSVSFSDEGEREKVQDHFGAQLATGLSDRTDLRFRYEYVDVDGEAVHAFGMGPKFGLRPERIAFYIPVGMAFGQDLEPGDLLQIHPTVLVTLPITPQVDVNASGKAILWKDRDIDDLLAFNLGLGIGPDLRKWVFRPEAGVLVNPGEDGRFWHLSAGFTYYVGEGGRR